MGHTGIARLCLHIVECIEREASAFRHGVCHEGDDALFDIAIENYGCKIKITSTKDAETFASITSVVIKRKESDESVWDTIKTIAVTVAADLNYIFIDKYTRSRRTYDYSFTPMNGTTPGTPVTKSIYCDFDSMLIEDSTATYELDLNLDTDFDTNNSLIYQETLNSKYPFVISNGLSDYFSGSIEVLPLPLDANNRPTIVGSQKYKERFIDFLKNGNDKLLKLPRGQMWMVSIDAKPKLNKSDFEGAETVKFSFTETSAVPILYS